MENTNLKKKLKKSKLYFWTVRILQTMTLKAVGSVNMPLEKFRKDILRLNMFRKDILRLKKLKDKYLKAVGRLNMPFEKFRMDILRLIETKKIL